MICVYVQHYKFFFLASMQRLIYLRTDTSRLYRAINFNQNIQRCLSNISSNNNKNETELYKPSTAKQETPVADDLKGGGKVWSAKNPGSIHIAPLGAETTIFVPTSSGDGKTLHETTVYTTQGQVNFADPLKTHTLQTESTSAFESLAPKISSTDVYSNASSPTEQYADVRLSNQDSFRNDKTTDKTEIPIQRESDIRDDILRESLKYVDEKGWTMEAIRTGVRACNQPTTIEGLFSTGYDLVEYFTRDANRKMSSYMNEKAKKGDLQGTLLLIDGLKYRLSLVIPYANTWDQALAEGALPQNALRSWKSLLDLSSDAWYGTGDTSTDFNWYSKRLLLAAVYKSAEIYMLQDQSINKIDTMNFLERRLVDFQTIGSVRKTVSKSLSDTAQIASGLFSVVRNLTSRR